MSTYSDCTEMRDVAYHARWGLFAIPNELLRRRHGLRITVIGWISFASGMWGAPVMIVVNADGRLDMMAINGLTIAYVSLISFGGSVDATDWIGF
jgi:hypothetical protein